MKTNLREKYHTKGSAEINKLVSDIQNGKVMMEQSIWQKIIKHMYEPNDY